MILLQPHSFVLTTNLYSPLLGRLLASTSGPPLVAPELSVYSKSEDSVVLVCQAPRGHQGILFMLYDHTRKVVSFFVLVYCLFAVPFPRLSQLWILLPLLFACFRWIPKSCQLVSTRFISLWGQQRTTLSNLASSAASIRTWRIVSVPSARIWSSRDKPVCFHVESEAPKHAPHSE